MNGNIQLYEQVTPSFQHPDFFAAAGHSKEFGVYEPIYKAFLKMVHGDSKQTLRVLVGYYRQKCKSLVYENRKLRDAQMSQDIPSFIDINNQINLELLDKRSNAFCIAIDNVYETYLHKHFCSWNDLASPLVPPYAISGCIRSFEQMFPICSIVLSASCHGDRQMTQTWPGNMISLTKRFLIFQHFHSMCRLKNPKKLTTCALVESLSQTARGVPRIASGDSTTLRY